MPTTEKPTAKDATVFARVPARVADNFKQTAEEHDSTLSADVRSALELVYSLRMMDALADPANFKANVKHFGDADEVRIYWESFRDDVIGLLGDLIPEARARHRLTLPDLIWNEPPTRAGKGSK